MEAQQILKSLVDGQHPFHQTPLKKTDIVCHGQVREALREVLVRIAMPQNGPKNAFQRWTDEEDGALLDAFNQNRDVRALAEAHDRSPAAIEARLIRLQALRPDQARYWKDRTA